MRATIDQTSQDFSYLRLIDTRIKDYPFYFTLHQTKLLVASLQKLMLFLKNDKGTQGIIFSDVIFSDAIIRLKLKCARTKTSLVIVIWQDYWCVQRQFWIKGFDRRDRLGSNLKVIRILNIVECNNFLQFLTLFCD